MAFKFIFSVIVVFFVGNAGHRSIGSQSPRTGTAASIFREHNRPTHKDKLEPPMSSVSVSSPSQYQLTHHEFKCPEAISML